MMATRRSKTLNKYVRTHMRTYTVRCNKEYDADIIALLDKQPNVTGYIKAVLRAEAARRGFADLRVENKSRPINPAVGKFNPEYYPAGEDS